MRIILGNGKIILSDRNITIRKSFGQTKVISKDRIQNIQKTGSLFYGTFICCTIIGLPRGIRMLVDQRLIELKTYDDTQEFWLTNQEYRELQDNL